MAKYHINKQGVPSICHAQKGQCPLGGADGMQNHFDTEEQAQSFIDKQQANKFMNDNAISITEAKNEKENDIKLLDNIQSENDEDLIRDRIYQNTKIINNDNGFNTSTTINDQIKNISEPDGGATFDLNGNAPTSGYCASPYPQYSKVFSSANEVTPQSLNDYFNNVKSEDPELAKQDNTYIGVWNDPSDGKIYVDISKHYTKSSEARKACKQHDQIAFFDLNTMNSVTVNQNAKSGQK